MKLSILLLLVNAILLSITISATAQDLDFQRNGYPQGSLSHTFVAVGDPAVDVTVNLSGNTELLSPQTGTLRQPRPVSTGLQTQMNFNNGSQSLTTTITFAKGVGGLWFKVFNIDQNQSTLGKITSQDEVVISAYYDNNPIPANITPSPYTTLNGNVVTGIADDSTSSIGTLVTFGDYVNRLVITYRPGLNSPANPNQQSVTISDLYWSSLPVALTSFRATNQGAATRLEWSTAGAQNADRFIVEHGLDAINFVPIGEVKAFRGVSQESHYLFSDDAPSPITYYRLRIIDTDGTRHLSKTIVANQNRPENTFVVYPNPSDGQVVNFQGITSQPIRILSILGHEMKGTFEQNGNRGRFRSTEKLPAGVYLLQVDRGVSLKFLVRP